MRDNSKDLTLERNYIQKWRFLIQEYRLVKARKHLRFRFAQNFYAFHGTTRQTFPKYYNRFLLSPSDEAFFPVSGAPIGRAAVPCPTSSRRSSPSGSTVPIVTRYMPYSSPVLKQHTPKPSTIYAITKRHGVNRLTKPMQQSKRKIIKTRAGELGHLDSHHLSRDLLVDSKRRYVPDSPHRRLHPLGLGRGGRRHQEPFCDVRNPEIHQLP